MAKLNDAIKYLGLKMNGVIPQGNSISDTLKNLGVTLTGKTIVGHEIADVITNIADNYEGTPALNIEVVKGNVELLGKLPSELQEDIVIGLEGITGTLKYITEYTGFSGDVSEQSGHYIALKATSVVGATITGQVIGGTHGAVTLDSDGILICRIANNSQSIKFIATKDEESTTRTFALTELTLEEAPQPETELTEFKVGQSVTGVEADTKKTIQEVTAILSQLTYEGEEGQEQVCALVHIGGTILSVYKQSNEQNETMYAIMAIPPNNSETDMFCIFSSHEIEEYATQGWQNLTDNKANIYNGTITAINQERGWNGILIGAVEQE